MEWLQRVWWFVADTIVPASAEHLLVRDLNSLSEYVQVREHEGDVTTLLHFHNPVVRAVIHEAKFMGNGKAWRLLGEVVAAYISVKYKDQKVKIIPIPLSGVRLRERGYNQVVMVLKQALPYMKNASWQKGMLRRANMRPQTELNKTERKNNVKNTFESQWFAPRMTPKDVVYVLLDDVLTTGSTTKEARRVLQKEFGIRPVIVALAH